MVGVVVLKASLTQPAPVPALLVHLAETPCEAMAAASKAAVAALITDSR